jgi:DeoR family transcriptional regulator, fructose operon transcriptional repressor
VGRVVSTNKPISKDQNAPLARRQEELLQLVEAKGQLSVDELARHFSVSDDTIRRDHHQLERRRVLLRTHGGAVSTALLVHRETPFLTRAHAHADARTGGGPAYLGWRNADHQGGSTTFAFAASLGPRRNLTVVTNNVALLSVLPAEAVQDVYVIVASPTPIPAFAAGASRTT